MVAEMQQTPMGPEDPGFEEPYPGGDPMMPEEAGTGPSPWLYLLVVLAAIGGMVFYVRRRKKKREELLKAEDEDDI
jgi:LPXTG-motif cell wall-anchored protein